MTSASPSAHSAPPLRILIADDHEMARAGVRSLLGNEPGLTIVGEAADGVEAVAACAALRPDVALLDVRMPHLDGLGATQALRREHPQIKVIILTMHESLDYLVEALKAGAMGYVLKDATRRELIAAIRQVGRGETCMNQTLMTQALRRFAGDPAPAASAAVEELTPREVDVLRLLVQGQTNRQIGANLHISPGTVKVHVEHIIAKLAVADRTQAAVRAVELRLV
jgi:DNA-binding NarL/FixJ family response regulator